MSAVVATRRSYRELVDGTLRVQIDIEPQDKAAFLQLFPEPGAAMGIAALAATVPTHTHPHDYSKQAQLLRLSGFCRSPDVWRAAGSEGEYDEWLRTRACVVETTECSGDPSPFYLKGVGPYGAIPLCAVHAKRAEKDQSAWGVEKLRVECCEDWCWEVIKQTLGYASMRDVPPAELLRWAQRAGVDRYLPGCYREAA